MSSESKRSATVEVVVRCDNCESGCTACDGEGEVVRRVPEDESYLSSVCVNCGGGIYYGHDDEFWMHSDTGERDCPRHVAEPKGNVQRRWTRADEW